MERQGQLQNDAGHFGVTIELVEAAQHLTLLSSVRQMIPAILDA